MWVIRSAMIISLMEHKTNPQVDLRQLVRAERIEEKMRGVGFAGMVTRRDEENTTI